MNDTILMNVYEKNDYIRVAEAVTRAKKEFTEEDVERLLTVYEQKMEDTYGLSDKALVKLFMVLNTADWDGDVKDAPLLNLAGEADQNGLTVLAELCRDRSGAPELAVQAKNAALAGEMDEGLALAVENPEPEDGGLLAQVMALPTKYREAIFLRYYEGYEVREIAKLLGRSPALVSTHLKRGKEKLKTMLGGTEYA